MDQRVQAHSSGPSMEKHYHLPDGQVIINGDEQFHCPEALFHPSLLGMECLGTHGLCYNFMICVSNIALSGCYQELVREYEKKYVTSSTSLLIIIHS